MVITSDYRVPSTTLIEKIQTTIDPEVNHGEGIGLAPIGHVVSISAVSGHIINISSNITYDTGYSFEDVKSYIENAVDEYLEELRQAWEDNTNGLIVRISRVEAALLNVQGILDIADTKLNGADTNVMLEINEIPVRGEISG